MTYRLQRALGPLALKRCARVSEYRANVGRPTRRGGAGSANSTVSRMASQRVDDAGAAVVDGIDPQTGRRIVPYEPLINWTRPYPTVDQNVRGTGIAAADGPEIEASPHRSKRRLSNNGHLLPRRRDQRTSIPAPTLHAR